MLKTIQWLSFCLVVITPLAAAAQDPIDSADQEFNKVKKFFRALEGFFNDQRDRDQRNLLIADLQDLHGKLTALLATKRSMYELIVLRSDDGQREFVPVDLEIRQRFQDSEAQLQRATQALERVGSRLTASGQQGAFEAAEGLRFALSQRGKALNQLQQQIDQGQMEVKRICKLGEAVTARLVEVDRSLVNVMSRLKAVQTNKPKPADDVTPLPIYPLCP